MEPKRYLAYVACKIGMRKYSVVDINQSKNFPKTTGQFLPYWLRNFSDFNASTPKATTHRVQKKSKSFTRRIPTTMELDNQILIVLVP